MPEADGAFQGPSPGSGFGSGAGADADPIRAVEKLQGQAANPSDSVWVSANAGSGKTRVLVDRVARLLLAGAQPQKILCLTYTRAAAAEMQDRLFKTLGLWTLASEEKLRGILTKLGEGGKPSAEARRLFARALETPGGLRLQTIHGFCESVLRRFPAETGLSPRFQLLEEEASRTLRLESAQGALLALQASADAADRRAAARFFAEIDMGDSGGFNRQGTLEGLAGAAFGHRARILAEQERKAPPGDWARRALGLAPEETEEGLWAEFLRGADLAALSEAAEHLLTGAKGSAADRGRGAALKTALRLSGAAQRAALRGVLLTKTGTILVTLMTGALTKARPDLEQALRDFAAALEDLEPQLAACALAARSADFARFARLLIARYDEARQRLGALDFDDLIARAAELFDGAGPRAWALFKLDEGVDHILVDEAQDTSAGQWRVASSLAEEFFVGESARGLKRTLFVVGDEKQSIYSFQGADPEQFAAQRARFDDLSRAARIPLSRIELTHSFRSSPVILEAVDRIFENPEGLTSAPPVRHLAARPRLPGRVECWPVFSKAQEPPQPDWWRPEGAEAAGDPRLELAEALAARIDHWIRSGEPLAPGCRAVLPGDVLVLTRNRDGFSRRLISALKRLGQPVAGEDRIGLRSSLAVQDLLATARAALLPADSLSLATALRSPIFSFAEADLLALTDRRDPGESPGLWAALTRRRGEKPHWAEAHRRMGDLIARVDFLRPYEFFETILCGQDGRRRLLGRLGAPAAEPIDELLAQALAFETGRPPTLQGFLRWADGLQTEIKRDLEQGAGEIRVMTVHGAKGLEADLVVLADNGAAPNDLKESRLLAAGEGLLWMGGKSEGSAASALQAAEARLARIRAEHRRLLYVALTRARMRLVVCGWKGRKAGRKAEESPEEAGLGEEGSWHRAVWTGLKALKAADLALPAQALSGLVLERSGEPPEEAAPPSAEEASPLAEPWPADWAERPVPPEPAPPAPLAPSRLEIEAEDPAAPEAEEPPSRKPFPAPGLSRERAVARGLALHRILARLADPETAALDPPGPEETPDLFAFAEALTARPDLAEVFAPGSEARILNETPLFGPLAALDGRSVSGAIDRLILRPDSLLIVDFKTGAPPAPGASAPVGYLRQMAVYAAAAGELFPDLRVSTALLWLDARPPRLDPLDSEVLAGLLEELRAKLARLPPEASADPLAEEPDEAAPEPPPEAREEDL